MTAREQGTLPSWRCVSGVGSCGVRRRPRLVGTIAAAVVGLCGVSACDSTSAFVVRVESNAQPVVSIAAGPQLATWEPLPETAASSSRASSVREFFKGQVRAQTLPPYVKIEVGGRVIMLSALEDNARPYAVIYISEQIPEYLRAESRKMRCSDLIVGWTGNLYVWAIDVHVP